jgi:hypothetical protein
VIPTDKDPGWAPLFPNAGLGNTCRPGGLSTCEYALHPSPIRGYRFGCDGETQIELDATGLPRLGGSRFYEAWLRNAAGMPVPIGNFNEGRNVTLWAGVSPKVFTTLTVTREQTDGDQASSGEKKLVGTVTTGG